MEKVYGNRTCFKKTLKFKTGVLKKDEKDDVKREAWETYNNMIISWILGSVSESIKMSIMFMSNGREIWNQLEKRFSLTNETKKYKICKDLYEIKQGKQIREYYTLMRCYWEELQSLNALPSITSVTTEITSFIEALNKQQEEQKLFQFLNGLMKYLECREVSCWWQALYTLYKLRAVT